MGFWALLASLGVWILRFAQSDRLMSFRPKVRIHTPTEPVRGGVWC